MTIHRASRSDCGEGREQAVEDKERQRVPPSPPSL